MKDPKLDWIAGSGRTSRKSYRNISRNFHNRLKRSRRVLPVHVSMVNITVRQHRPKVKEVKVPYPMIGLKDWATYLLSNSPRYILGGFSLSDIDGYTGLYGEFWRRYRELDEEHPIFDSRAPEDWGRCIPYAIHGDEGRGKAKVPILIQSYQMIIGPQGVNTTNISGSPDKIHPVTILA